MFKETNKISDTPKDDVGQDDCRTMYILFENNTPYEYSYVAAQMEDGDWGDRPNFGIPRGDLPHHLQPQRLAISGNGNTAVKGWASFKPQGGDTMTCYFDNPFLGSSTVSMNGITYKNQTIVVKCEKTQGGAHYKAKVVIDISKT